MEENITKVIDLAEKGLNSMADKLGVALPHLWEVLIRQQYVEAIQIIIALPIFLVITFLFVKFGIKAGKEALADSDGEFIAALFITLGIIILIVDTILVLQMFGAIGKLINPEYYAIETITNFIKSN